jgi:hypothetical protein
MLPNCSIARGRTLPSIAANKNQLAQPTSFLCRRGRKRRTARPPPFSWLGGNDGSRMLAHCCVRRCQFAHGPGGALTHSTTGRCFQHDPTFHTAPCSVRRLRRCHRHMHRRTPAPIAQRIVGVAEDIQYQSVHTVFNESSKNRNECQGGVGKARKQNDDSEPPSRPSAKTTKYRYLGRSIFAVLSFFPRVAAAGRLCAVVGGRQTNSGLVVNAPRLLHHLFSRTIYLDAAPFSRFTISPAPSTVAHQLARRTSFFCRRRHQQRMACSRF